MSAGPQLTALVWLMLLLLHAGSGMADAGQPITDLHAAASASANASQLPMSDRPGSSVSKSRRSSASQGKRRLYIDGDVIVGALFPMHKEPPRGLALDSSNERTCGEIWEQYGIHRIETFLMTLDRINKDPHILPDVKLGCDVRDSCWDVQTSLSECKHYIRTSLVHELDYSSSVAAAAAVATATATDRGDGAIAQCVGAVGSPSSLAATAAAAAGDDGGGLLSKPIAVLIGAGSSQVSMQVQDMLQLFSIPQLDSATSVHLSDKSRYRYFLRVAPPDSQQAIALADLVEHFGWTYISTVYTDGTYGSSGMDIFNKIIRVRGICVATADHVSGVDSDQRYDEVIRNMQKTPNAKVIVCFCEGGTVNGLFRAMKRLGENSLFIVSSDGWNTRPDVVKDVHDVAVGSFSIKMDSPEVPGFDDYFFNLTPQNNLRNPWFNEFWEFRFGCNLPRTNGSFASSPSYNRTCTGKENLREGYDVDAKLGFVVNSMYAMALGLDAMQRDVCGSNRGRLCEAMLPLNGSLFLQHLKLVNFTTYSNQALFFNENGDPPGKYLYMNYQLVDGLHVYKQVGSWEAGTFSIDSTSVQWRPTMTDRSRNQSSTTDAIPESVCSYPCTHGSVKKAQPQLSRCCWLCDKCPENAILPGNETCVECSPGWWPDSNLTECLELPITHIRWSDVDSALPLTLACLGLALTIATTAVFARHNSTAVVKASTRELSYLMLAGIALAHISTLAFFARPTAASCYVTRILPGLSFSAIYGAVLTKTNRIARILSRSKRIALDKPRCMTTGSLVAITAGLMGVEAAISAAMLAWQPADAVVVYPDGGRTALLVCNTTAYGVLGPLGFDFLLIVLCTFYAVKTRNVPANFNEAKFIGFAMYTTCVIWVGFVAIYFGSDSKVMTMTLSITLSSTVSLLLLFGQKIYIIVWKPEKNHRSAFTTATKDVRCHIGSATASAIECSARLITPTNGTLRRNASSSGSLSSSSSRFVALRQKTSKASQRPSTALSLVVKSRDSNRLSSTAVGASSPDGSGGFPPLARIVAGPLWEETGDGGEGLEMTSPASRSVACQTECTDDLSSSAEGTGLCQSGRGRRHGPRSGSAGSSFASMKEVGVCSELATIEDEENQPLLASVTTASTTPRSEEPKPAISRIWLVDATANQLDLVSEEVSTADEMVSRSRLTNGITQSVSRKPTFSFGSSECVLCQGDTLNPASDASAAQLPSKVVVVAGPAVEAEAHLSPAEANADVCVDGSNSRPRRSTMPRPASCKLHVALNQSKSWASDSADGGSSARAASWDSVVAGSKPSAIFANNNVPRSHKKLPAAKGLPRTDEPAGD